jgi:hypothetical protein
MRVAFMRVVNKVHNGNRDKCSAKPSRAMGCDDVCPREIFLARICSDWRWAVRRSMRGNGLWNEMEPVGRIHAYSATLGVGNASGMWTTGYGRGG